MRLLAPRLQFHLAAGVTERRWPITIRLGMGGQRVQRLQRLAVQALLYHARPFLKGRAAGHVQAFQKGASIQPHGLAEPGQARGARGAHGARGARSQCRVHMRLALGHQRDEPLHVQGVIARRVELNRLARAQQVSGAAAAAVVAVVVVVA